MKAYNVIKKTLIFIVVLVIMLLTVSCGKASLKGSQVSDSSSSEDLPPPAEKIDSSLVKANNEFGFKVFKWLNNSEQNKNIFISPTSMAIALSMTYNGAEGETKEAMAKVLELGEMSLDQLNKANADLGSVLKNPDPGVEISIANSIWARKGEPFKEDFLARNEEFYKAMVEQLDFDSPKAVEVINNWVREQTRDRIDKIIESPIEADTVMFLINAIYFKGGWTKEFDPERTAEGTFILEDGTKEKCSMMSQTGEFPYYKGENFQVVCLPYGSGRVGMYVFLPDEGTSLNEFLEQASTEKCSEWMQLAHESEGYIALPKFKVEYETELGEALKALGMEVAFDAKRADFSNMYPISPGNNIYLGKVKHKTFLDVNEEGTEAGAVTSVEIKKECAAVDTFRMVVERPFFIAIRDNSTGAVLFMGAVKEPKS